MNGDITPCLKLHLVDTELAVVRAWRCSFEGFPEIGVQQGNLLAVAYNAVVSPANGYGFMDGGVDAAYVQFFGSGVEAKVQEVMVEPLWQALYGIMRLGNILLLCPGGSLIADAKVTDHLGQYSIYPIVCESGADLFRLIGYLS